MRSQASRPLFRGCVSQLPKKSVEMTFHTMKDNREEFKTKTIHQRECTDIEP